MAALAKAKATPGSPAAYPGTEAEFDPSDFFDAAAAARFSKATLKGISDAKAAKKKAKTKAAPRGLVAEANFIAAKHAASHAAAAAAAAELASSPAKSALSSLTVNSTAQHQSAADKPGKRAVTLVFDMVASSGNSAAALQATASRASAIDKLTARQSAVLLPPSPDQAPPKFASAPAAHASLSATPFSFHAAAARSQIPATDHTASSSAAATAGHAAAGGAQHIQTGSPLPLNPHKLSSTAAAAAEHAAAGGTQVARMSPEPEPATASEGSDAEEEWEVVTGAEHLKQPKNAKAQWLASGATCTVKR